MANRGRRGQGSGEAMDLQASGARALAADPARVLGELQISLATAIEVARLPGDAYAS